MKKNNLIIHLIQFEGYDQKPKVLVDRDEGDEQDSTKTSYPGFGFYYMHPPHLCRFGLIG